MPQPNSQQQSGFTLLELSVVIIIVGLLVVAVMSGAGLVRQSQLRGVVKEVEQIKQAMESFRVAYNKWPGDYDDAAVIWPDFLPIPADPTSINGNGDGNILHVTPAPATIAEGVKLWQHLMLSQFFWGEYEGFTGTFTGLRRHDQTNPNVAGSGLNKIALYSVLSRLDTNPTAAERSIYGTEGIALTLGEPVGTNTLPGSPVLSAVDMLSIDKKMDDGLPSTGLVYAMRLPITGTTGCVNAAMTAVPQSVSYLTDISQAVQEADIKHCALVYWIEKRIP